MTQPMSPDSLDELRRLMHRDWADGAVDGLPPLADLDRAARLYGIVADPYHHLAFGNLSRLHLMMICIYGMLEERQFDKAFRALGRLHRMEREVARERARQQPVTGKVEPAPASQSEAPAASPEPPAPAAPLSRAAIASIPVEQILAVYAERLGVSPDELEKSLAAHPPFT